MDDDEWRDQVQSTVRKGQYIRKRKCISNRASGLNVQRAVRIGLDVHGGLKVESQSIPNVISDLDGNCAHEEGLVCVYDRLFGIVAG